MTASRALASRCEEQRKSLSLLSSRRARLSPHSPHSSHNALEITSCR
jgi:hypothetical protein